MGGMKLKADIQWLQDQILNYLKNKLKNVLFHAEFNRFGVVIKHREEYFLRVTEVYEGLWQYTLSTKTKLFSKNDVIEMMKYMNDQLNSNYFLLDNEEEWDVNDDKIVADVTDLNMVPLTESGKNYLRFKEKIKCKEVTFEPCGHFETNVGMIHYRGVYHFQNNTATLFAPNEKFEKTIVNYELDTDALNGYLENFKKMVKKKEELEKMLLKAAKKYDSEANWSDSADDIVFMKVIVMFEMTNQIINGQEVLKYCLTEEMSEYQEAFQVRNSPYLFLYKCDKSFEEHADKFFKSLRVKQLFEKKTEASR